MTRIAAIFQYFGQFIPVFPEYNVPDDTPFPYGTLAMNYGDRGSTTSNMLHIHYYTTKEAEPNAMAENICRALSELPELVYDGGGCFIALDDNSWYPVPDEEDKNHRHRIVNFTINWS